MNLDALAALLEAENLGVVGDSIFFHTMPDVKTGILFRLPLTGVAIDHELPGRYKHPLQVILRGVNMEGMLERARLVQETLTIACADFEGMYVDFIRPRTLPIVYPRSEQSKACEASINFDCCYVLG